MKRFCLVLLLLLSVSPFTRADEASKRAKVKELFQLTYMENRLQQSKGAAMAQAQAFAAQQLASFDLPDNMNKDAKVYYDKLYTLVASKYDWNKLEPKFEQIYVDLYTEEELDGILAFYKSPVGHALLSKTPEATSKILEVSKQQMELLTPQMQKLTEDYVAQLKKESESSQKK